MKNRSILSALVKTCYIFSFFAKIFPSRQLRYPPKKAASGLGLAIVRELVDRMGVVKLVAKPKWGRVVVFLRFGRFLASTGMNTFGTVYSRHY